jgi:CDP-diacylglycerol--glycerol-3-phosphate 3-phosphatidyltransferase
MDPLADKIMVCSAFIAFVGLNWMPAWMVVIIVGRELAITGLRLLAASKQVVLAAEGYGKHKTISQIVAIISMLVLASYQQWGTAGRAIFGWHVAGGLPWIQWFASAITWVAVILTLFSGCLYLWRNRAIYLDDL